MPRYVFPPRPKSKIKPEQLPAYESQGFWLWQPKYDGDRCVSFIEDGKVHLGNRHNKWHSDKKFSEIRRELLDLKLPPGNHRFDGELVSVDGLSVLVLFDVLQLTKYLIGVSQMERLEKLAEVCDHPTSHPTTGDFALQVSQHIWMAPHGFDSFGNRYEEFSNHPLIEGLVLRKKDSTLDNWGPCEYEVDWQLRCRRGHKNYRF